MSYRRLRSFEILFSTPMCGHGNCDRSENPSFSTSGNGRGQWDYFAGLDISMDETHVCVLDREGEVVHENKTA
jgi:hypothetical protein